jgi:hypothetical protein
MVADFFTKPLQGALFRKLKSVIMGEIDVKTFLAMSSGPKERVEKNIPTVQTGPYGLTYIGQTNERSDSNHKRLSYAETVMRRSE